MIHFHSLGFRLDEKAGWDTSTTSINFQSTLLGVQRILIRGSYGGEFLFYFFPQMQNSGSRIVKNIIANLKSTQNATTPCWLDFCVEVSISLPYIV